jgi:transcriptional regulator with XRE-family HTH domain
MARNYKELQAKMDPASLADNRRRVREELQRMALEELRGARQLTQADMAEMLDVPQSSISRIEQRADMYLSTLRNYIHAVGGELRIQAVFPDGGTVVIDRFGEYEERPYVVDAMAEGGGIFRLRARPLHHQGAAFSTKKFKVSALQKRCEPCIFPTLRSLASEQVWKRATAGSRSVEVARRSSAFSVFRIWWQQVLTKRAVNRANASRHVVVESVSALASGQGSMSGTCRRNGRDLPVVSATSHDKRKKSGSIWYSRPRTSSFGPSLRDVWPTTTR